jgi:hypothetical protein
MKTLPTTASVREIRSDVVNVFAVHGGQTYAIVNATKYALGAGAARPIWVNDCPVRLVSEQVFQSDFTCTPGEMIWLDNQYRVLVSVDGSPAISISDSQMKELHHKVQARAEEQVKREKERALAQQEQIFAEMITKKIIERGKRLKKHEETLVMFPELNDFRPALDHELQTQRKLLFGLDTLQNMSILASEVTEANNSETITLKPLRDQYSNIQRDQDLNILQQQLTAKKGERELIIQARRKAIEVETGKEQRPQLPHKERLLSYSNSVIHRRRSIKRDIRILAKFADLENHRVMLEQESQAQDYFEQQELQHIDRLELELDEANKRYAPYSALIRQQAQQLQQERHKQIEAEQLAKQRRDEEERSTIARTNAENKIQHEQKLQQEHEQKLQQERILQQRQAARLLEANNVAQKKQAAQLAAEVKNRQQAIDKCADRYERSLDAIEYKSAKLHLESIRHYIKEDADIDILCERIAHLHSRCEKSYPTTLPDTTLQPTQDYTGAKTGAVIGGLLGLAGGPLVAIAFASLGSVLGDLVAPNTKSSQSSSKQTPEQQKWASLIKEISEVVQTLSEKKEQ